MGLDIRVRTTVQQVLDSGDFDDQPELERLFTKACENLGLKPQDGVKTHGHPTAWAMDLPLPKSHFHRLLVAAGHQVIEPSKGESK